jgi:hypothetical protein
MPAKKEDRLTRIEKILGAIAQTQKEQAKTQKEQAKQMLKMQNGINTLVEIVAKHEQRLNK